METAQQVQIDGGGNVIVQLRGDHNRVNVEGLPYLTLTNFPSRRLPPKTELDLLDPFRRSIEHLGREQDMATLWGWLHSGKPIAVRAVTGRAGAGKTRMAVELIARLEKEEPGQWHAGFATRPELRRFAEGKNLSAWGWQRPTLIVVDYAAALVESVNAWLHELAENIPSDGQPLRLLLLEREANTEQGWLRSLHDDSWSGKGVQDLFDPFEPLPLQALADQPRRAVLAAMLRKAAEFLKKPAPAMPQAGGDHVFAHSLAQPVWADPLYLMMAALVAADARLPLVEVLALSRTDLAFRLAERELARLRRFVSDEQSASARLVAFTGAAATLTGGLTHDEARAVVRHAGQTLGLNCPQGDGSVVEHLEEALPRAEGGVAPVFPDIVGEAVVLSPVDAPKKVRLQHPTILELARLHPRAVITCVIRTVQDFASAGRQEPLDWLGALVEAGQAASPDLLIEIGAALDEHAQETLALREKAAEVTALLVDRFARLARTSQVEPVTALLGDLLNNFSLRLSALGLREEALEKAQEAGGILRQLAQARPDAFLPNLATSLNNLANMLSALGRREEALEKAQEAEGIRRQLAQARPNAFLPDLALLLNNLANVLSALGRREEALEKAQEAEGIYRQLAQARLDAFLPSLALSLNNLANALSDLGRWEEALEKAQEAEGIYRQLAQARLDAFLPSLGMSLITLAATLSNLGRREEALEKAQEAEGTYRQLAQARPDAFLSYLATSLYNLAPMLSALGRREEALEKAQEAEGICRQLAQAHPVEH